MRTPITVEGLDLASEPAHACSGCGTPLAYVERYPWYFCSGCLEQATDGDGRRLAFANASFEGGLVTRYAPGGDWSEDAFAVICRIHGRQVLVQEARFGGVVAQPMNDLWLYLLEAEHRPEIRILDLSTARRR